MADPTQFGHDQLGHLLADYLLEVPRFQRSYAWDVGNVEEYLSDLATSRAKDVDYFMGTVVFARPDKEGGRRQIVDGQQRLATTALLFIAIRDRLRSLGRDRQADEVEKRFLRGYVLAMDDVVERLILSPADLSHYQALLDNTVGPIASSDKILQAYEACARHLERLTPAASDYGALIRLSQQLETRVQVLVAEATDLPEAYVIFETLNDRGADLTTADLLKNYLFSTSKDYFRFVEERWTQLEANFERPEDLVKFIRHDFVSRHGSVSARKLYRSIQGEVGGKPSKAKAYVSCLVRAQELYLALRDPEHSYWSDVTVDVRDALYAYRRFGLEASIPLLLATFENWDTKDAARLLNKVAAWSVRGLFAGRLGGGVADDAYGDTARAVSSGQARNQPDVRGRLDRLMPTDEEFCTAFASYGDISTSRAKYLLAMLEKADDRRQNRAEKPVEWYSRSITVEHIMPISQSAASNGNSAVIHTLGNLALLEKKLNRAAGSKPFAEKRSVYKESSFELTKRLALKRTWRARSVALRTRELAELACRAWPNT